MEAARAGDQGRGFAVVASEVRTLSQRAGAAANEIRRLSADSLSQTKEGEILVRSSGETMQRIVVSIKEVKGVMSEIASDSQSQAIDIEQVAEAVVEMDRVAQQNAALVEEAAAAADSLKFQSSHLMKLLWRFKIADYINFGL